MKSSVVKSDSFPVDISVIIPIYNEEQVIPELYQRLKTTLNKISVNHELIFINDGSKDNSFFEILELAKKDSKVFFINFSRNFGHQIAVTAGIEATRGKSTVVIDGDLQDPPELIIEMHQKLQEGFEVVYAQRAYRKGESLLKTTTASLFYRTLKKLTSFEIPVDTGDFRIVHYKVITYLRQMPEQNKFIRAQVSWLGFKQACVQFNRDKRKYGKTGYSYTKLIQMALDGITGFSDKPLQIVTKLGFIILIISFLVILYALISLFVLEQKIAGWTSLIISSMFLGGIQLFSIGIIGEYISRINKNVMNRPLYIVSESNLEQLQQKANSTPENC